MSQTQSGQPRNLTQGLNWKTSRASPLHNATSKNPKTPHKLITRNTQSCMGESDRLLSGNQVQRESHGLSKQSLKHFQLSWTDMQLISQTTDLLKTGQDWETYWKLARIERLQTYWKLARIERLQIDLLKTGQDWETTDILKLARIERLQIDILKTGQDWETTDLLKTGQD